MNEHLLYCKSCKEWVNPKNKEDVRYYCTVLNASMYSVDQVYHSPVSVGWYMPRLVTRKTGDVNGRPVFRMEARLGKFIGKDVSSLGQDATPLSVD